MPAYTVHCFATLELSLSTVLYRSGHRGCRQNSGAPDVDRKGDNMWQHSIWLIEDPKSSNRAFMENCSSIY